MSSIQALRHRELVEDQDEKLDEIGKIAENLHYHAQDIDLELKKQDKIIKKVGVEMDKAHDKLNRVEKQLSKLMQTNDPTTLQTIMSLTCILMALIVIIIVFWGNSHLTWWEVVEQ